MKDDLNMDELVIHDDEIAHVYIMHPSINGINQTFLTHREKMIWYCNFVFGKTIYHITTSLSTLNISTFLYEQLH